MLCVDIVVFVTACGASLLDDVIERATRITWMALLLLLLLLTRMLPSSFSSSQSSSVGKEMTSAAFLLEEGGGGPEREMFLGFWVLAENPYPKHCEGGLAI